MSTQTTEMGVRFFFVRGVYIVEYCCGLSTTCFLGISLGIKMHSSDKTNNKQNLTSAEIVDPNDIEFDIYDGNSIPYTKSIT